MALPKRLHPSETGLKLVVTKRGTLRLLHKGERVAGVTAIDIESRQSGRSITTISILTEAIAFEREEK